MDVLNMLLYEKNLTSMQDFEIVGHTCPLKCYFVLLIFV